MWLGFYLLSAYFMPNSNKDFYIFSLDNIDYLFGKLGFENRFPYADMVLYQFHDINQNITFHILKISTENFLIFGKAEEFGDFLDQNNVIRDEQQVTFLRAREVMSNMEEIKCKLADGRKFEVKASYLQNWIHAKIEDEYIFSLNQQSYVPTLSKVFYQTPKLVWSGTQNTAESDTRIAQYQREIKQRNSWNPLSLLPILLGIGLAIIMQQCEIGDW